MLWMARRRGLAHAHDHFLGADGLGGELAAVEHQVRQRLAQRAVLQARRLALGGVDHDDRRPRAPATARSFVAVGKPAPPRPRRPARSIRPISGDSPAPPAPARRAGGVRGRPCARRGPSRRGRGCPPAAAGRAGARAPRAAAHRSVMSDGEALIDGSRSASPRLWNGGSSDDGVPERRAHSEPSGPPGSHSSRNSENTPAPPRAALRSRRLRRPAVDHACEHRREHGRQAEDAEREQPRALDVAARAEAVQQRDRPARVRQPVDRPPGRRSPCAGAAGS